MDYQSDIVIPIKQWLARVLLTPMEVRESAKKFKFVRTWKCAFCQIAQLRIRASDNRAEGPSNFVSDREGHATLPSGALNWNGLAEERGWQTHPVKCPACQSGLSLSDYKARKRLS